jgi:hypothetical protein
VAFGAVVAAALSGTSWHSTKSPSPFGDHIEIRAILLEHGNVL